MWAHAFMYSMYKSTLSVMYSCSVFHQSVWHFVWFFCSLHMYARVQKMRCSSSRFWFNLSTAGKLYWGFGKQTWKQVKRDSGKSSGIVVIVLFQLILLWGIKLLSEVCWISVEWDLHQTCQRLSDRGESSFTHCETERQTWWTSAQLQIRSHQKGY